MPTVLILSSNNHVSSAENPIILTVHSLVLWLAILIGQKVDEIYSGRVKSLNPGLIGNNMFTQIQNESGVQGFALSGIFLLTPGMKVLAFFTIVGLLSMNHSYLHHASARIICECSYNHVSLPLPNQLARLRQSCQRTLLRATHLKIWVSLEPAPLLWTIPDQKCLCKQDYATQFLEVRLNAASM